MLSPWLRAVCAARAFPHADFGPVLALALKPLAFIFRGLVTLDFVVLRIEIDFTWNKSESAREQIRIGS
jgi:hypothetical protein